MAVFSKSVALVWILIMQSLAVPAGVTYAADHVIRVIDFTGQDDGSAVAWLEQQGFEFELNAKGLNPRFENDALVISTRTEAAGLFGLRFAQQDYLYGVKRVEIVWGVNRYPEGADWRNGVNSVPIAVMLSFGTEKLSSGLPLGIKSAPYFLSPFIGKKEEQGKMYIGKLWQDGGRYFCVASGDQSGKIITTDFEVDQRFKSAFNQQKTPPITAFAFQKNTSNTNGASEAFIKKITFLSE
ncbi:hypothetical protein [Nitrosomonas sp.]|uniref:hypothetical protein n=1 Tax=Nitrosomonas sp. TaxID=42353 RepID=UPI00283D4771|nr:hypothetical protein [Nitrosomonas sp.]MDR4513832.1 hypothetical protein [Nitrosomonas sp.]